MKMQDMYKDFMINNLAVCCKVGSTESICFYVEK